MQQLFNLVTKLLILFLICTPIYSCKSIQTEKIEANKSEVVSCKKLTISARVTEEFHGIKHLSEIKEEEEKQDIDYLVAEKTDDVSRGEPVRRTVAKAVPSKQDNSFKAYMPYTSITARDSKQWEYRQMAYTDSEGFRRIGEDYVIALGTYYASQCGERFVITLSGGRTFTAITGDIKADIHTDYNNQYRQMNNRINVVEFLVDPNRISKLCRQMGDMSYGNMEGAIVSIEKIIEE